ncbi:hypothetical protein HFD88_010096 [Aspergillus terreus]|nr:hypothetical protein HFD88_010096 [Aspergillus terreus]
MARLCVPGFPFRPSEKVPRFTTRPAFRSFPARRIVYRPTTPTPIRSFEPVFSKPGIRYFPRMKKGSRIPVRVVPAHISRFLARGTLPTVAPVTPSARPNVTPSSFPATEASLARLEERREARQARSRPWAQSRSSIDKQSRQGHLSAHRPCTPHPTRVSRSVTRPQTPVSRSGAPCGRCPHHCPQPRPQRQPRPRVPASTFAPRSQPPVTRSEAPVTRSVPTVTRSVPPVTRSLPPISEPTVKATRTRAQRVPAQTTSSYAKERRVRFGVTTVVPVSRWIVRQEHVYPAPPLAMGHLQGWDVTPLSESDEAGEDSKFVTYWGSDSYIMLTSNHAKEPCDRYGCAWNTLARIQRKRPHWSPERIFKAWLHIRSNIRKQGGFAL